MPSRARNAALSINQHLPSLTASSFPVWHRLVIVLTGKPVIADASRGLMNLVLLSCDISHFLSAFLHGNIGPSQLDVWAVCMEVDLHTNAYHVPLSRWLMGVERTSRLASAVLVSGYHYMPLSLVLPVVLGFCQIKKGSDCGTAP